METTNKYNIDNNIYNSCLLIYNLVKLDVELFDENLEPILQLKYSEIPFLFEASKTKFLPYIEKLLIEKKQNEVIFHIDKFQLCYMGVGLWKDKQYEGMIIIGPFLSDTPNNTFISNIIKKNNLTLDYRDLINQFYKTLNILDRTVYNALGYMLINLLRNPIFNIHYSVTNLTNFNDNTAKENPMELKDFYGEIELRYMMQKQLMNAIRQGFKDEALRIYKSFNFNPSYRIPTNPLRATKNLAFSLSSFIRIAALEGNVSPVNLHISSDRYASMIEKASSLTSLENILSHMITYYCDLVKRQSTSGYSRYVSKAIDFINFNYQIPLSLSVIADKLDINPSHLSRQFKKETKMTITEFINRKKIEEAKYLIKETNHSITDISMMVGFENHNYFYTVFKQFTTLTPKRYLDEVRDSKQG